MPKIVSAAALVLAGLLGAGPAGAGDLRIIFTDRYVPGITWHYADGLWRYGEFKSGPFSARIDEDDTILDGPRRRRVSRTGVYGVAEIRRAHREACLNRYRTYDPRSDTFVGRNGRLHRCRL